MLHEFFFFLGTVSGLFFKKAIEAVLFLIVSYMILSEYTRDKRKELKYLTIGFLSLAFERLVMSIVLAYVLFGNLKLSVLNPYLPIDPALEFFALILLANAFIFPVFEDKIEKLRSNIKKELLVLSIIFAVIEILWLIDMQIDPTLLFAAHWGNLVFTSLKIIILIYPLFYLIPLLKTDFTYYKNVVIAFLVYLIAPILQFINIVFFNSANPRIEVAMQPFPFISVLLFTRVIYLKLVDKAVLKEQLKISEKKYKEEKEISEMKDEFISVVSHELRTPLTSMKLYTSLLKDGKFGKITKQQEKALSIIKEENNRLSFLIDDILNLSKLESKSMKLNIEDFDFSKFSKNKIHYSLAQQKGIKVISNVSKNFIIKVDEEKFKQVFINLLSNAVKYTNKGGAITVSSKNKKDNWEISVADTGKGIPKEEIPKLFSKFYQVEDYMTRKESGTGLGLAIVKRIVELHKGDITVESELGKGSKFTVSIPKII